MKAQYVVEMLDAVHLIIAFWGQKGPLEHPVQFSEYAGCQFHLGTLKPITYIRIMPAAQAVIPS